MLYNNFKITIERFIMNRKEKQNIDIFFKNNFESVYKKSKLDITKSHKHHRNTSCFFHSIAVAYYSYKIAKKLRLKVSEKDLITGALLHDYFLYDWHITRYKKHGFSHPVSALKNAETEFELSSIEKDIIRKHMFPLTISPPKYKESILVCLVDKACCLYEVFKSDSYKKMKLKFNLA